MKIGTKSNKNSTKAALLMGTVPSDIPDLQLYSLCRMYQKNFLSIGGLPRGNPKWVNVNKRKADESRLSDVDFTGQE